MITLSELAERLGVSTATVSNALTGKGRMRSEKRQEIIETAAAAGYDVSRSMVKQRKKNISIITEQIGIPFSDEIIRGVCAAAEREKISYSIHNINLYAKTADSHHPNRQLISSNIHRLLVEMGGNTSGILYVAQFPYDATGFIPHIQVPVVFAYCYTRDPYACVNIDDAQGANLATSHLAERGRTRIAMISGPVDSIPMTKRMAGYQRALVDHGLLFDPGLIKIGDWNVSSGYQHMQAFLAREERPDAVFCQSDHIAVGAIRAIRDAGLRVPEDVAVVGFDDAEFAELWDPSLTSIHLPCQEMGQTAFRLLMDQVNKCSKTHESIKLNCSLALRQSS